MTLREQVADALKVPNPRESQSRVHRVVADGLTQLTRDTTVKTTEYFNHSWAPDMVLKSGGGAERYVYLRFQVKDETFADDLKYLADRRPFFFDLVAANRLVEKEIRESEAVDVDVLLSEYQKEGVLVSEIPAVEAFKDGVEKDRAAKEATGRVVIGGRGVVDVPAADAIVQGWHEATSAVGERQAEPLRTAINKIETYLSEDAALDFESTLRSRWIAAGGAPEAFPGQQQWNIEGRQPWELARLVVALIDERREVPAERWEQIASAVSMSELGHELSKLGQPREGGSVNAFMRAALRYWTAKYAYAPPLESDTLERFDWAFGRYSFSLNLVRCQAYFTDFGRKWSNVPRPKALPYINDALDILSDENVLGVGLLTTEEDMSVTLRSTATASLGDRVQQYIGDQPDAAWRSARITRLEMRVPSSPAKAVIDFDRSVVQLTDSVPLRTFVDLVARYVARLDKDELRDLQERLDGKQIE